MKRIRILILSIVSLLVFLGAFLGIRAINKINVSADDYQGPLRYLAEVSDSDIDVKGENWFLTNDGTLVYQETDMFFDGTISSNLGKVKNLIIENGSCGFDGGTVSAFPSLEGIYVINGTLSASDRSFERTTNIKTLYIDGTANLGYAAFAATPLEELYISEFSGVTPVPNGMYLGTFQGCGALKKVTLKSSLKDLYIIGFDGSGAAGSEFVIDAPRANVNFAGVSQSNYDTVTINSKTAHFCTDSFQLSNIQNLTCNANNVGIESDAFKFCGSLKNIYIKELAYINSSMNHGAFRSNGAIESIYIEDLAPNAYIGSAAFYESGCADGANITIHGDSINIASEAFFGFKAKDVYIDTNTTYFGSASFKQSTIKNLTANSTETYFAYCSFWGCGNLENIYVNGLSSIDSPSGGQLLMGVFQGCGSIKTFTAEHIKTGLNFGSCCFSGAGCSDGFDLIFSGDNISFAFDAFYQAKLNKVELKGKNYTFSESSFKSCGVNELILHTKNTIFDADSFSFCGNLKKVYIEELTAMKDGGQIGSFYGCGALEEVYIASGRKEGQVDECGANVPCSPRIGFAAFMNSGCANGFNFYANLDNAYFAEWSFRGNVNEVVINGDTVYFAYDSFKTSTIKSLTLNTANTSFEREAFSFCSSLKNIYIYELKMLQDPASGMEQGVFQSCGAIESLVIDNVDDGFVFGARCFESTGCADGYDFEISANNLTFSSGSFGSSNLKSFTVNGNNATFATDALKNTNFKTLNLNTTNTIINLGSFAFNSSLETVYIKDVKYIGEAAGTNMTIGAFQGCGALKSFTISNIQDNGIIGRNSFYGSGYGEGFNLFVQGKNYSFTDNSADSSNIKNATLIGDTISFGSDAFINSQVKKLKIDAVVDLSVASFAVCQSLKEVYIKKINSIENTPSAMTNGAFEHDGALEKIVILDTADSLVIPMGTFQNIGPTDGCEIAIFGGDLTFNEWAGLNSRISSLVIDATSVTVCADAFREATISGAKITPELVTTFGATLTDLGITYTTDANINDYIDKTSTENVVYEFSANEEYLILKQVNLKTITEIIIDDNCNEIASGALDGCNDLIYNIYENGYYLGTATNPYYALIKAEGHFMIHEDCVIYYDNIFTNVDECYITISETSGVIDVSKYNGSAKVVLELPSNWDHISQTYGTSYGLKNLEEADNVYILIPADSNIKSLTEEEFKHVYVKPATKVLKVRKNLLGQSKPVVILDYATDSESIKVGDMIYASLNESDGTYFYLWSIDDNTKAYHVFETPNTYDSFMGIEVLPSDRTLYTVPYVVAMSGDGCAAGSVISVQVYKLTNDGIVLLGTDSKTLEEVNLDVVVPDVIDITIEKTDLYDLNQVLIDRAVPHALRCVILKDITIVEGADFVTLDGTYVIPNYLGDVKITYTLNCIECYDHGHACSFPNKEIIVHIVPSHASLEEGNTMMEVSLTPNYYLYDGAKKTPTLKIIDKYNDNRELVLGTDYEISPNSIIEARLPGNYPIIIFGKGTYSGSRTLSWKIQFATVTVDNFTYGDEPSIPVVTGTTRTDQVYRYLSDDLDKYTYTMPKNAGTYTIEAVFRNYGEEPYISDPYTFTIYKRDATVTVISTSSYYESPLSNLEATSENIIDEDLNTAYSLSVAINMVTPVGLYDITINVLSNNYNITKINETESYEIKPRKVEPIWVEKDYVYNGSVQGITAYITNRYSEKIYLDIETDEPFKNAGTYTATAKLKVSDTNYYLEGNLTHEYSITPKSVLDKTITKTLTIDEINYDGSSHTNTLIVKDGETEIVLDTDYTAVGEFTQKDAGIKIITITGINNYKDSLDVTWHIVGDTFQTTVSLDDWEYDSTPKNPVLGTNISGGEVILTYSKVGELSSSTTVPTNVGDYVITYTIRGKESYDTVTATDEFKITVKKIAKPDANQTIYKYNGEEQTYTLAESKYYTVVNDKLTLASTIITRACLNDTNNVHWLDDSITDAYYQFTINPADAYVNIDNKAKVVGEQDPEFTYTITGMYGADTLEDIVLVRNYGDMVGDYKIYVGSVKKNNNYTVHSVDGTLRINIKTKSTEESEVTINITENNKPLTRNASVYLQYCDAYAHHTNTSTGSATLSNVLYAHYSVVVEFDGIKYTKPIDITNPETTININLDTSIISTVNGGMIISSDNILGSISSKELKEYQDGNAQHIAFNTSIKENYQPSAEFDINGYYTKNNINGTVLNDFNVSFSVIYDQEMVTHALLPDKSYSFQNITIPVTVALENEMSNKNRDLSYLHIYKLDKLTGNTVVEVPKTTEDIAKKAKGDCFFIREVCGTPYIVLHTNYATEFCFSFEDTQSVIVKKIANTSIEKVEVNIFTCLFHWLILLSILVYILVEVVIFVVAPRSEKETEESENDSKKKKTKKLSMDSICHLVASLIWLGLFIIGCIYAKCAICVIFLIIQFILLLCVIAYVFIPYLKVIIDKLDNWNKKRMEKKKNKPVEEKVYEKATINKDDSFIVKVKKALKNVLNSIKKALDKVKKKIEQAFDYVMDKTTKGLEKAAETVVEAKEQVSLTDATKAALASLPTFEISKKTIADYLEKKYKSDDIIINRKANVVANTKLPLADTHYAKVVENGKENKNCFVYVYELETMYMDKQCTGMLLLIKLNKELKEKYIKAHKSAKMSAFPIGGQWMAMPIDSSYDWKEVTKIIDETYEYQLKLIKDKLVEKKAKAEAKSKTKA